MLHTVYLLRMPSEVLYKGTRTVVVSDRAVDLAIALDGLQGAARVGLRCAAGGGRAQEAGPDQAGSLPPRRRY